MRERSTMKFRPGLEQFEEKLLLSADSLTTHAGPRTQDLSRRPAPVGTYGYLAFRVTNTPWQIPYSLFLRSSRSWSSLANRCPAKSTTCSLSP